MIAGDAVKISVHAMNYYQMMCKDCYQLSLYGTFHRISNGFRKEVLTCKDQSE